MLARETYTWRADFDEAGRVMTIRVLLRK